MAWAFVAGKPPGCVGERCNLAHDGAVARCPMSEIERAVAAAVVVVVLVESFDLGVPTANARSLDERNTSVGSGDRILVSNLLVSLIPLGSGAVRKVSP